MNKKNNLQTDTEVSAPVSASPVETKSKGGAYAVIISFALLILFSGLGYTYKQVYDLQNVLKMQSAEAEISKKVYVYNLERVIRELDIVAKKTQFEDEIIKLNDELFAAEKKIKSIKDANVKADFSDVYLNNLKLKRDTLISNYENTIKDITDKVNTALNEISKEKGVTVVFVQSAVAVNSSYVEDLTEDVIKKVKNQK